MKNQKMTPWIFSVIVAFGVFTTPVLAQENTATDEVEQQRTLKERAKVNAERLREQLKTKRDARIKALETAKSARPEKRLESAKDLAQKLVDERAELLRKLSTGEHLKRCRPAAKAEAVSAINAAIARLGTIDATAATTVEEVRTLIKETIIAKNRVYVSLIPALRGMCASDWLIGAISETLTPAVERLADQGHDVAGIQEELDLAKTDAENAYSAYKKVANNPGTATFKTDLAAAKELLKSAREHLKSARVAVKTLEVSSDSDSD